MLGTDAALQQILKIAQGIFVVFKKLTAAVQRQANETQKQIVLLEAQLLQDLNLAD